MTNNENSEMKYGEHRRQGNISTVVKAKREAHKLHTNIDIPTDGKSETHKKQVNINFLTDAKCKVYSVHTRIDLCIYKNGLYTLLVYVVTVYTI